MEKNIQKLRNKHCKQWGKNRSSRKYHWKMRVVSTVYSLIYLINDNKKHVKGHTAQLVKMICKDK